MVRTLKSEVGVAVAVELLDAEALVGAVELLAAGVAGAVELLEVSAGAVVVPDAVGTVCETEATPSVEPVVAWSDMDWFCMV